MPRRIAAALLLAGSVAAQAADWSSQLDRFIEGTMREDRQPGVAIGIVREGRLVYARGFGVTALDPSGVAVTPATLFHLGSITKPFVATALLQQVEAGRIALDAPVARYLPYFTLNDPRAGRITVAQMLTHTAGLPDVDDYRWYAPEDDDAALERYVRGLSGERLLFEPGTRFAYSNMAFEVLGDLLAKTCDDSFEGCVTRHILIPLAMHDTTLMRPASDPRRVAQGYTRGVAGTPVPIRAYPYNRAHTPSSNLVSNVADMAHWMEVTLERGALRGKRLLRESSYTLMWHPAASTGDVLDAGPMSAAMGWFVGRYQGEEAVLHGGSDDGFRANLVLLPARRLGLIYMTNADYDRRQRISAAALRLALGRPLDAATLPKN